MKILKAELSAKGLAVKGQLCVMTEAWQFLNNYIAAVRSRDVERLAGLYCDDARIFDLWGTWIYEGRQAWREAIGQWFSSLGDEVIAVSFDEVKTIERPECMVISAIVTYEARSLEDKPLRSMQNRVTWILLREQNDWRAAHEHTSAPVSPETMKAILTR